jgi:hypothetical protein
MMISWWSKHVRVILSVLACDIWINVLLQTSALVGPLYIVNWNARWHSEKKEMPAVYWQNHWRCERNVLQQIWDLITVRRTWKWMQCWNDWLRWFVKGTATKLLETYLPTIWSHVCEYDDLKVGLVFGSFCSGHLKSLGILAHKCWIACNSKRGSSTGTVLTT